MFAKRLFVILISLFMFFNSSLYVIFYQVRLIELSEDIRKKVKYLDPDTPCDGTLLIKFNKLEISNNPMIKVISEDEISYNGSMYDVAFTKTCGDSVWLFCISDSKEDELLRNIIIHFNNTESQNEKMQYFNVLFSFLSNAMVPGMPTNAPGFPQPLPIQQTSSHISRGVHNVLSPPPKPLV